MNIFSIINKTHSYNNYKEAVQFANSIPEETWNKMSNLLFKNSVLKNCRDMRISGLSSDFFDKEQVFYHGKSLNNQGKNYKLDENRVFCEEMGDGLYISPSKKVAAFHAGLAGKIFKLRLNTDRIAQVNRKQIMVMLNTIANNVEGLMDNLTGERLNVIIRMLFQKNGYDTAYTGITIGDAFENAASYFEKAIGEEQRQLCVYNNDVIEVLPKSIKERVGNQILQIKQYLRAQYVKFKFIYGDTFNYHKVNDFLSRSAELRAYDFASLKKKNVTDIIDFRQDSEIIHMGYNEYEAAKNQGINYHNIPTDPDNITKENVDKFIEIITNVMQNGGKVHIYCHEGADRTGFYTYIYERLFKNVAQQEAYKHLISGGWHYSLYPNILENAESYVQMNKPHIVCR